MPQEPEHGAIYWFLHNTLEGVTNAFKRHWLGTGVTMLVIAFVLFGTRAIYHPYVIMVRTKSFMLVPVVLLFWVWRWARRKRTSTKVLVSAACLAGLAGLYFWGGTVHDYLALYNRYRTLRVAVWDELPTTNHERMQPLNSIYSLAHEKVATEMESPQRPHFVRIKKDYMWTMSVEPAHISRFSSVKEVIAVSDASPDFSKRDAVSFEVGENMLLGKNTRAATIKNFNLWRYLNYEPKDVRLMKDDKEQWVQVVALVRWKGFFFPRPEFGGVQIVRQQRATLLGDLWLMMFGTGEWISPQNIQKYPFLVGQSLLPHDVSRYIAESFRFQNGFLGPMPFNHNGDVRVPDLPADVNEQPFTAHFEHAGKGTLYHYFDLEPFDPNKQGLSLSIFIPADGSSIMTDAVYVYDHSKHGESLTGVSAIASKVMDSRMMFDWKRHKPVEHRPFIRDIGGKRHFFWLTSVVTLKEGTNQTDGTWFIAGSYGPNIVLTDAKYNVPVWVGSDPGKWIDELKADATLQAAWVGKR